MYRNNHVVCFGSTYNAMQSQIGLFSTQSLSYSGQQMSHTINHQLHKVHTIA